MARRSYDQFCGLARALDVVGERWTLLLVRNLLLGPRRYGELLQELPGITTNLLAKRLAELEASGLIERQARPSPGGDVAVYTLTADGAALEPAIHALAGWGGRWLGRPRASDTLDLGWGMLSLKRRYRGGLHGALAFVVDTVRGPRRYTLRFDGAAMTVRDAAADPASDAVDGTMDSAPIDAEVTTDAETLRAVFMAGDHEARHRLRVTGNRRFVEEVLDALAPPRGG